MLIKNEDPGAGTVAHQVKVTDDGPNVWVPDTHVGDHVIVPGPRLQPSPFLAVAAIWVVNQWVEDPSLSVSPSLCVTLPFKK